MPEACLPLDEGKPGSSWRWARFVFMVLNRHVEPGQVALEALPEVVRRSGLPPTPMLKVHRPLDGPRLPRRSRPDSFAPGTFMNLRCCPRGWMHERSQW